MATNDQILSSPFRASTQNTICSRSIFILLDTKCCNSIYHLKQTHAQTIKSGLYQDNYVAGSLVKCYVGSSFRGTLEIALKVFDQVSEPHVFLWNSIIRAFLDHNAPQKAILFYQKMIWANSIPNKFTFPSLLKACTLCRAIQVGVQLHAHVFKHGLGGDRYIQSAGIQLYASCGKMLEARRLFDGCGEGDAILWNAMLDGYLKCGDVESAQKLFEGMPHRNVSSWNAMITGLARCGRIEDSRLLFDEMPERDEVSWSAMIDGYVRRDCFKEALAIFREMQRREIRLRDFVLSSVLSACANLGALNQGRWIHKYIERNNIQMNAVLGTSLVDMYAKCGHLDMALEMFYKMESKEVFSWNAIIGGHAIHGNAKVALNLFSQMQMENFRPDNITFVGVLKACAHAGLVEDGLYFFNSMKHNYGVRPMVEHYGCMVDLLGRAGRFDEAAEIIDTMPMRPNAAVWGALLGACRIHGNVELGERIGEVLLELEPQNSGRYALLSNIYARAGRWDDVSRVRKLMKERGVRMTPGRSFIDLDGVIHEFVIGGGSHPQLKEIRVMLEEMIEKLRLVGYVPNSTQVLFDVDGEEKESAVCQHSEKLAIAFGLLKTNPGTIIRVVKNLRICEDCHVATKLISLVYNREIIVRDRVRYHHFKGGSCSCKEYW